MSLEDALRKKEASIIIKRKYGRSHKRQMKNRRQKDG